MRGSGCGQGRLQAVSQAWGVGGGPTWNPWACCTQAAGPGPEVRGAGLRVLISNRLQVALLLVGWAGLWNLGSRLWAQVAGGSLSADPSAEGGVRGGEGENRKSVSWLWLSIARVTTCSPQPPCLTSLPGGTSLSFLVLVTGCTSVGRIPEAEIYKITATDFYPLQEEAKEEDRLAALRKILNSGVFYFSWPNDGSCFDLTVRAQKQGDDSSEWGNSFFW